MHSTSTLFSVGAWDWAPICGSRTPKLRSQYYESDPDHRRQSCCCPCGRRHLMASSFSLATGLLLPPLLPPISKSEAHPPTSLSDDPMAALKKFHPPRPDWYEEFYAQTLLHGMESYESQIAGYKAELFDHLVLSLNGSTNKKVVELGVGTGPNFKYYAAPADLSVIAVDPNAKMEKYARDSALAAGFPSTNFTFIQGVGESLPLGDNSVDAVIATLVLCSVKDIDIALKEVRRVLKPGGLYLFIEHVAASDGSQLRFWQSLLDPLEQFVVDGCHLTRETGKQISGVGFSSVSLNTIFLPTLSLISPHIYGIACK